MSSGEIEFRPVPCQACADLRDQLAECQRERLAFIQQRDDFQREYLAIQRERDELLAQHPPEGPR